ncbi:hypothetical protein V2A60_002348 [Cordyceps javanica]
MTQSQRMVIVGAGPVGALAALYAAQRGFAVAVYELRPDTYLRDSAGGSLGPGQPVNLVISERGMSTLRHVGQPELLQRVVASSVCLRGRMIHAKSAFGGLLQSSQGLDALGGTGLAIDRTALVAALLDSLDALPNVKLFFNHKLISADFHSGRALFEDRDWLSQTTEVRFDIMVGADGAHSTVRHNMTKVSRMDYRHEYLDVLWCEFRMKSGKAQADGSCAWRFSPDHLHIWPAGDSMFIAVPSKDDSFACTLFMPAGRFASLRADESQIPQFFDTNFPGVRDRISDTDLIRSLSQGPHQSIISIKCKPYHFGSSGVILGDAAHAMALFYGQGTNEGMEDVRVLFSVLDKHAQAADAAPCEGRAASSIEAARTRTQALAEYSSSRWKDAHTTNDLAMQNYLEMRTSGSTIHGLRKTLQEFMRVRLPSLGWRTRYSRVVFSNGPYAERVRGSEGQGRLLSMFAVLAACPVVAAGLYFACARSSSATKSGGAIHALWQWSGC